jgi:hypothetical protein
MNLFAKLGQKIEECKRHVFNQGYSYEDASNYVDMVLEGTGLQFGMFDYVEKNDLRDAIEHLNIEILA